MTILSQKVQQYLHYLRKLRRLALMRDYRKSLKTKISKAESLLEYISKQFLEVQQDLEIILKISKEIKKNQVDQNPIDSKLALDLGAMFKQVFPQLLKHTQNFKKIQSFICNQINELSKLILALSDEVSAIFKIGSEIIQNGESSQILNDARIMSEEVKILATKTQVITQNWSTITEKANQKIRQVLQMFHKFASSVSLKPNNESQKNKSKRRHSF